jgi:His-Xaa-Ser system protein HxsD
MKGLEEIRPSDGSRFLGDRVAYDVDIGLFARESVLRACHKLTARCYVHLERGEGDGVRVTFASKIEGLDVRTFLGDFGNELIEQELRQVLVERTSSLRELLVAQAFAEGNLLDPERDEGDYRGDAREAGVRR